MAAPCDEPDGGRASRDRFLENAQKANRGVAAVDHRRVDLVSLDPLDAREVEAPEMDRSHEGPAGRQRRADGAHELVLGGEGPFPVADGRLRRHDHRLESRGMHPLGEGRTDSEAVGQNEPDTLLRRPLAQEDRRRRQPRQRGPLDAVEPRSLFGGQVIVADGVVQVGKLDSLDQFDDVACRTFDADVGA